MFAQQRDIVLDRGLTDATGQRHRRALLRAMDGRVEAELAGLAGAPLDEAVTDAFLAERVARLGGYAPVTPELMAELSRSDRDRLLLETRAETFGERLYLTTVCQNPACGKEVDLDLTVGELLGGAGTPVPELVDAGPEGGETLRLRPVLGRDDPEAESIWPALVQAGDWARLTDAERQQAALALARADRGPELGLAVACPHCRLTIEIEIDPMALLVRELRLGGARLLAEVHCLAFHYGWSEAEILALPRARRWRYLELIAAQVTGGSLSDDWR